MNELRERLLRYHWKHAQAVAAKYPHAFNLIENNIYWNTDLLVLERLRIKAQNEFLHEHAKFFLTLLPE
jgi:hypothetical protein